MIFAGLLLLAVGLADLVRVAGGRMTRTVLFVTASVVLFVAAAAIDASGWALVAIGGAAAWVLLMPADGSGRAGLLPVAALAVVAVAGIASAGPRPRVELFGATVVLPGPGGGVAVDVAVLVAGCAVFLIESSNIAVRAALRAEAVRAEPGSAGGLKGGRLIGPLERLLVFGLTLSGAYTLLAAILAAKGIVRFPEISRDAGEGNRAEYFLVGSLVSWTLGVAAAFLVWWAGAAR